LMLRYFCLPYYAYCLRSNALPELILKQLEQFLRLKSSNLFY
jgi:hypothetical protein